MNSCIFSLSDIIGLATLCILFLTFIAIVWYSIETMKLRKVNQKQNFDTNFYNLLNNYNYIVSNLEFREHEDIRNIYKGDQFFKRFYNLFKINYNKSSKTYKDKAANEKEVCKIIYNHFYNDHPDYSNNISHYFSSVSQILKFINDADNIDESIKEKYFKVLQSCFTLHELLLLFYHGISSHCDRDTYFLLDRYSLLINISVNDLIDISHLSFYSQYDK